MVTGDVRIKDTYRTVNTCSLRVCVSKLITHHEPEHLFASAKDAAGRTAGVCLRLFASSTTRTWSLI